MSVHSYSWHCRESQCETRFVVKSVKHLVLDLDVLSPTLSHANDQL